MQKRSDASRARISFKARQRVRDQLEKLVQEMLDKGVLYDDARREFEKMFIARALQRTKGNLGDAAGMLGLHRNTITRKMAEYRIKRTA
jgi:Fis family transcriptional regulator, factor for inversion stimulation protein